MLSDAFSDCILGDVNDGFPSNKDTFIEDYEYSSDSDLEDDGDMDVDASPDEVPSRATAPSDAGGQVGKSPSPNGDCECIKVPFAHYTISIIPT